jgi:hypothetical protein
LLEREGKAFSAMAFANSVSSIDAGRHFAPKHSTPLLLLLLHTAVKKQLWPTVARLHVAHFEA